RCRSVRGSRAHEDHRANASCRARRIVKGRASVDLRSGPRINESMLERDQQMPRQRTLVLMEPPFCFWDQSMDRLRDAEETIPGIGILVLAALARQKGYAVHVVDAKRAGTTNEDAARRIIALKPDYVGLSCTTISVTNGSRVAKQIKAELPGCTTIIGGS